MAKRYFICQNANRAIGGKFQFEVFGVRGGCVMGVYATDAESDMVALDEILKEPRNAVQEIDEKEYSFILKKNPKSSPPTQRSPVLGQVSPPLVQNPAHQVAESSNPVVVDGPKSLPNIVDEVQAVPSVLPAPDNAIKTGDIEPSVKPQPASRRKVRKSDQQSDES